MSNGANALVKTLINSGVDTCFTNPGTSEMHFVAALDSNDMRGVLTLFEGVATGAADGYARIANKPAATLLHLGCGLGNGLANLHNARKARVPMINIIGDHAIYHKQYDAPLESDIETVARNVSNWIRTSQATDQIGHDAAEAIAVAQNAPAEIATLILPADVSWGEGGHAQPAVPVATAPAAPAEVIDSVAQVLLKKGKKTAILLGRRVLPEYAIISDEAQTSGVKLPFYTAGAHRHDVLTLTGGSIGQGLPVAVGAAIAGKDRPVIALVGDGTAMYTIQALWTIVREKLDVTTIIFNNRSYAILNIELERVGAESVGPKAKSQLDLSQPEIDFVSIAKGMGMPAVQVKTAKELAKALKKAFSEPGPHLIDAVVPSEYEGLKLEALPHVLGAMNSIPTPIAKAIKNKIAP